MENSITVSKATIDSWIFFSMGITLDDDAETVIMAVVKKAYFDATNQGAFNTSLTDPEIKELAKSTREKLFLIIKPELIEYKSKEKGFEDWFIDTCKRIHELYAEVNGGDELFSFGNAQKFLSMCIKYLFLLSTVYNYQQCTEKLKEILSEIYKDKPYIILPMDSFIIDAFCREGKLINCLEKIQGKYGLPNDLSSKEYPSSYLKGWSKWDVKDYEGVYKEIKDNIDEDLIDWEIKAWIEQAKRRKK